MPCPQETPTTQSVIEVSPTVSPEVKLAAVQALLSEGEVEVTEVLRDRRGETLALVQRLLASAGIKGTFLLAETEGAKNEVNVQLANAAAELSPVVAAPETTPETVETGYLGELKARFDALPQLHPGVQWVDVERSLKADSESMECFQKWDNDGHSVNCYGLDKKTGEYIFASAWTDVTEVAEKHRNIVLDPEAEAWLKRRYPDAVCNGNAVDIAKEMGGQLAGKEISKQLKSFITNGWAYIDTPADIRNIGRENNNSQDNPGDALSGDSGGVYGLYADNRDDNGSLRAARRVKKA